MRNVLTARIALASAGVAAVAAAAAPGCRCTPPPVIDEPAAALAVAATFIDVDETPSDGRLPVVVQFFHGGSFVRLAGTTAIACNGVALSWNGLGYAERVPLVPPGGTYTISHTRGAVMTRVDVTVPPRPAISTPAPGANATRSPAFTILYPPGGGTSVRPGVAGPSGNLSGAAQPDDGSATINASGVGVGAGSVSLTRQIEHVITGTGFGSASFTYSTGHRQPVIWQ